MAWQYHITGWTIVSDPDLGDVFTPDIPESSFRAIDLRPTRGVGQLPGFCLVATPPDLVGFSPQAMKFGVAPDDLIPPGVINALGNALGITIDPLTRRVDDVLWEILTANADKADPGKWNPIRPTSGREAKGVRSNEIWLGDLITRRTFSAFDLTHGSIIIDDSFGDLTSGEDIGGTTPDIVDNGNTWNQTGANTIEGDGAGSAKWASAGQEAWIDTADIDGRTLVEFTPGGADNRESTSMRSNSGRTQFYGSNFRTGEGNLNLFRVDGGTTTLSSDAITINSSAEFITGVEANGTTIKSYGETPVTGSPTAIASLTDSVIDGTTKGGTFAIFQGAKRDSANGRFRRFYFDDLAAGDVAVAVTSAAATGAVGNEVVSGDALIAETGVASTGAVGSVAVLTPGNVTVEVTGVSSVGAVGDESVRGDANVAVTGASSTAAVGSVAVQEGVGVAITGAASTGAVGTVAIVGAANIQATGPPATGAVGSVVVVVPAPIRIDVIAESGVPTPMEFLVGQVGDVTVRIGTYVTVIASGVSASGFAGSIFVPISVSGINATGAVGSVQTSLGVTVFVAGVSAQGISGGVGISWANVPDGSATVWTDVADAADPGWAEVAQPSDPGWTDKP